MSSYVSQFKVNAEPTGIIRVQALDNASMNTDPVYVEVAALRMAPSLAADLATLLMQAATQFIVTTQEKTNGPAN